MKPKEYKAFLITVPDEILRLAYIGINSEIGTIRQLIELYPNVGSYHKWLEDAENTRDLYNVELQHRKIAQGSLEQGTLINNSISSYSLGSYVGSRIKDLSPIERKDLLEDLNKNLILAPRKSSKSKR